jgi:hypothetical protein
MKDFTKRFYDYKIEEVDEDAYFKTITTLVAEEFAFDKPESIKPAVRKLIDQIMRAKTRTYDAEGLVHAANNLVEAVELSDESEWN